MAKQKNFEIIEEGRFLTNNKLKLTVGGNSELCQNPVYESCSVPYSVPCLIYFTCQVEYYIRPCADRQQSCTEVMILCHKKHTMCIDKVYVV